MKNSILIADDDRDVVELLTLRCSELGLKVDTANNAMTALGKAEEQLPDAVILDVDMPLGNGLSVCEMMASHEELQCIPVIVLTGKKNEEVVRRCHELNAYYVLKSPNLWSRIEPLLKEIIESESAPNSPRQENVEEIELSDDSAFHGPTDVMDAVFAVLGVEDGESLVNEEPEGEESLSEQPWVLSIEDDDDVALALRLRLQEYGVRVIRAEQGMEGYRRAFLDGPRAIILDYELPQGNGDYVLRRLKESPATRDIPVIVLTGRKEASIERQMRALGASEFLTKPFDWQRLRKALDISIDQTKNTALC